MKIKISNEVLRVGGFAELTAANSDWVGRKIRADLNGHTTIEIDLSRTTFMDCTGLGALIALRKLARARNGGVRLLNPTPTVQRLLDVVRAGEIFEIVNTGRTDHQCDVFFSDANVLFNPEFIPPTRIGAFAEAE